MRPRVTFLLGLAMGLSSLLAKRGDDGVKRCWDLVPVVVAARDLKPGARLSLDDLSQRSVPERYVFGAQVKADAANLVIGGQVTRPYEAGEPLAWDDLTLPERR